MIKPVFWLKKLCINKIKTRPLDASNYLKDEADIAAYSLVAIEDGEPALLARALEDISKARETELSHAVRGSTRRDRSRRT